MSPDDQSRQGTSNVNRSIYYWLLVIPFIATLFPQFYNFKDPTIGGMPFFYWYQLAWIPISVLLTWYVVHQTARS